MKKGAYKFDEKCNFLAIQSPKRLVIHSKEILLQLIFL